RARELSPDLVLMDVRMPELDGISATKLIKQEMPHLKVIMLTVSDEDGDLFQAVRAGAEGYLLKSTDPDDLVDMIEGAVHGEAAITRLTASKLLAEFAHQSQRDTNPVPLHSSLTPREKEVLELVALGACNRVIADALCISENTVKNHLRNILEKLHLENRVQAVAFALREGLVQSQSHLGSGNGGRPGQASGL
ncbi:MAG: LuxR C-terminal-related transcriptional regulator, partial [Chloroflexota bacterium]